MSSPCRVLFSPQEAVFSRMDIGRQVRVQVDWLAAGECGVSSSGLGLDAPPEIGHWLLPMLCINYGLDFCRSPVGRLGVFGDAQFMMRPGDESDWNFVVRIK